MELETNATELAFHERNDTTTTTTTTFNATVFFPTLDTNVTTAEARASAALSNSTEEDQGSGSVLGRLDLHSLLDVGNVTSTLEASTDLLLNWTTAELDVLVDDWNGTGAGALGSAEVNATALRSFREPWANDSVFSDGDGANNLTRTIVSNWGDSNYPSGYTTLGIIFTAIFVTSLMIVIVVGNMLVIIAIATEKTLKTIQNWFIASLAVSDFLLGLVVMPFSLANELMGYWIFGTWWCEIHLAVDVLLCTASILNICMISLDRYWSITKAVEYLKQRTPLRAAVMICMVWVVSFTISVPPLLGWKKPAPLQEYPTCEVRGDTGYVIYSALGSFYIPSVIMVFVYIRIYIAARSRARRAMKKKNIMMDATKDKSTTTTSFSNASPPDKSKPTAQRTVSSATSRSGDTLLAVPGVSPATAENSSCTPTPTPASTPSPERRLYPNEADSPHSEAPDVEASTRERLSSEEGDEGAVGKGRENGTAKVVALSTPKTSEDKQQQEKRKGVYSAVPSVVTTADEADCVSELEHSSDSDQYRENYNTSKPPSGGGGGRFPLRRLRHLCRPPKRSKGANTATSASSSSSTNKQQQRSHNPNDNNDVDLGKVAPKIRDPEREKRRIARKKERRATLILGLIMASFILSWLPFFVIYVLTGLCKEACHVPQLAFGIAFWLGYCNSALNPIIYTIFNKDFRRAFRKILFK